MATLVLTAVGTALGGPLGGALGALAGRALDTAIIGSPKREGGRLKDLAVTTSSYGSNIPRHFGTVRTAGSIIWSTELSEQKETSGGGKGKPKLTNYSYSVSCAVALASRPIRDVGRIWADGNLLRGAAGDLKVGGTLRIHTGDEDQPTDPLMVADIGGACPAFRGIAYVVFEDLQLSDFGNRIPSLNFEVIADDGSLSLREMLSQSPAQVDELAIADIWGLSQEGGTDADLISSLGAFYPLACDGGAGQLNLRNAASLGSRTVSSLPAPIASGDGEFASQTGSRRNRTVENPIEGVSLRYYDVGRDFQPGLQRSRGRPGNGKVEMFEFPACLSANNARVLADKLVETRESGRDTLSYRVATLDPALRCGSLVRPVGEKGIWQVRSWEWRAAGVELELEAMTPQASSGVRAVGDTGQVSSAPDQLVGPTILTAFEAPWDGTGNSSDRQVFAALSSAHNGWRGSSLYVDKGDGAMIPIGSANRERATVGKIVGILEARSPHIIDRVSSILVQLADAAFVLADADVAMLAQGANQARIGGEIIQFSFAKPLGSGLWHLSTFLRGRGGTEHAIANHNDNEDFVLIDEKLTRIDAAMIGNASGTRLAALGGGDVDPVFANIDDIGASLRPLDPVKAAIDTDVDGTRTLSWVRRARGGWLWLDQVELPISEVSEAYEVRFIEGSGRTLVWRVQEPRIHFNGPQWVEMTGAPAPRRLEVRQVGASSLSRPLTIAI